MEKEIQETKISDLKYSTIYQSVILPPEEYPDTIEECHKQLAEKDKMIEHLEAQMYIAENEREDMCDNFNMSTNVLIERIKNIEEEYVGTRPDTSYILNKESDNKNLTQKGQSNIKSQLENRKAQQQEIEQKAKNIVTKPLENGLLFSKHEAEMRLCHNCRKEFPEHELKKHTIMCYRNLVRCKVCGEELLKSLAPEHLAEWREPQKQKDATLGGNLENLKQCIDHNANPNCTYEDLYGYSLAHLAIESKNMKIAEFLLDLKKIDINISDVDGNTPQMHAIDREIDQKFIDQVLSKSKIDLNKRNNKGETCLIQAVKTQNSKIVERLQKKGSSPNDVDNSNKNTVMIAQALQNVELTELLIKHGGSLRPVSAAKFKIRGSTSSKTIELDKY